MVKMYMQCRRRNTCLYPTNRYYIYRENVRTDFRLFWEIADRSWYYLKHDISIGTSFDNDALQGTTAFVW